MPPKGRGVKSGNLLSMFQAAISKAASNEPSSSTERSKNTTDPDHSECSADETEHRSTSVTNTPVPVQRTPEPISFYSDRPHQPQDVVFMQNYTASAGVGKLKTLTFQTSWYKDFPWLHCDVNMGKVLCHSCVKAVNTSLINPEHFHSESTFRVDGFGNWKKSREKFEAHQRSDLHRAAQEKLLAITKPGIMHQLDDMSKKQQSKARDALQKIVTSVRYLACEGLALRGKRNEGGNFKKLLELRSEDDRNLSEWLARKTTYTSSEIVNELLEIMAHDVIRNIAKLVRDESISFGIICDGTRDVSGDKQEAICIRYVTNDFEIHEDVVGLYHVKDTTGSGLAKMLQDVMIRLQLPLTNLRAQTYDGASNMSGEYSGCQAEIKEKQSLALYTHCGSHVSHLVTSKSVQESGSTLIRDALDCVQELGKYYKKSGKFKDLYLDQNACDPEKATPSALKPICPTRWLTRAPAVTSALQNYEDIISSLEKAAKDFGSKAGAKASGLLIFDC